jgi:hypothetical protein
LRGWTRRAAILCCFVVGGAPSPHIAVPLTLIALGALLHLAAKAYLVRRTRITAEGPYRWVRHPFYLANLLLEPGLLLFAGAWWAVPPYLVLAGWAYRSTIAEEESDLALVHGEAWVAYSARVPALLPWRGRAWKEAGPGPSLRNLLYEREIPRILRLISLPVGLMWWHAFRSLEGPFLERELLPPPRDKTAMLLVGFISAQALSWCLAWLMRAPRLDGSKRVAPERR